MEKFKRKGKLKIFIAVIVIAAAVIACGAAAFIKYRMSLIPKMSSEEILGYTLKNNSEGVITVGICAGKKAS